uniref:Uncharacterized protein n=1 Tax=viral metagenome TaxID=1070528 RepID=A0A6C0AD05_9ZZZZ
MNHYEPKKECKILSNNKTKEKIEEEKLKVIKKKNYNTFNS